MRPSVRSVSGWFFAAALEPGGLLGGPSSPCVSRAWPFLDAGGRWAGRPGSSPRGCSSSLGYDRTTLPNSSAWTRHRSQLPDTSGRRWCPHPGEGLSNAMDQFTGPFRSKRAGFVCQREANGAAASAAQRDQRQRVAPKAGYRVCLVALVPKRLPDGSVERARRGARAYRALGKLRDRRHGGPCSLPASEQLRCPCRAASSYTTGLSAASLRCARELRSTGAA